MTPADPQEEDITQAFELGYNAANGIRLNPRAIHICAGLYGEEWRRPSQNEGLGQTIF